MTTICISPPELTDEQLLAYLDHPEANQEIGHHLKRCAHCQEKAESLERFQKTIATQLYRIDCPPSLELGEYHLHMLPPSRMLVISQHVRECPHCAREVAELETYLMEPALQTSLRKQVEVLIARLLGGKDGDPEGEEFSSAPAFAGVRGDGDEPFIYQAGQVRIVIEVQDDVEQMGLKTLLGLVIGLESNEFTIQVSQGDNVIATTSVDEIGNFIISHLSPGHYKLILSGPNMEIRVQSLPVQ